MKFLLGLLFPLAACAAVPDQTSDHTARLGETARIGSLLVEPVRVIEDSRCPMNARCLWAGRVTVLVRLTASGTTSEAVLHSNEPLATAGGHLAIDKIEPESFMTNEPPEAGDYLFHFAVTL